MSRLPEGRGAGEPGVVTEPRVRPGLAAVFRAVGSWPSGPKTRAGPHPDASSLEDWGRLDVVGQQNR